MNSLLDMRSFRISRVKEKEKAMKIYFFSTNTGKIEEVDEIIKKCTNDEALNEDSDPSMKLFAEKIKNRSVEILSLGPERSGKLGVEEIQDTDINKIVIHKAKNAFFKLRHPVLVEHTGLYLKEFGDLPGGLAGIFWESLKAEKFCEIFKNMSALAKTVFGYCDGKKVELFEGEIKGVITESPSLDNGFQWDHVFIPENEKITFSELGERKNEISMRKKALDKFMKYIGDNNE